MTSEEEMRARMSMWDIIGNSIMGNIERRVEDRIRKEMNLPDRDDIFLEAWARENGKEDVMRAWEFVFKNSDEALNDFMLREIEKELKAQRKDK